MNKDELQIGDLVMHYSIMQRGVGLVVDIVEELPGIFWLNSGDYVRYSPTFLTKLEIPNE